MARQLFNNNLGSERIRPKGNWKKYAAGAALGLTLGAAAFPISHKISEIWKAKYLPGYTQQLPKNNSERRTPTNQFGTHTLQILKINPELNEMDRKRYSPERFSLNQAQKKFLNEIAKEHKTTPEFVISSLYKNMGGLGYQRGYTNPISEGQVKIARDRLYQLKKAVNNYKLPAGEIRAKKAEIPILEKQLHIVKDFELMKNIPKYSSFAQKIRDNWENRGGKQHQEIKPQIFSR